MEVLNKKIMVLGLMRSGIGVAELLYKNGAKLILCDEKDNENIRKNISQLKELNLEIHLGADPIYLLDDIDMLVISPGVPIDSKIVKAAISKKIKIFGEVEIAYLFSQNIMIAVSGTNGKTTSVSLLGRMFENAGKIVWVAGNIGFPLSSAVLNAKSDDLIVVEISSFQLETTEFFHPAAAALLNITEDHLNRHKNMEEYTRLKFRMFENQNERDIAVLNYDDSLIRENSNKIKAQILWFSSTQTLKQGAYVQDGEIVVNFDGKIKTICPIEAIKIPGKHNLENALAMSAIAVSMNIPSAVIRHTLITFEGVEHRIETVAVKNNISYINDSKGTNSDSTSKAVSAMKSPTIIILGGSDKNSDFTELCTQIKNSPMIKHAVLIGETANQFCETLEKQGYNNISMAISLEDAVKKAKNIALEGDNILLSPACASFDMFENYEERGKAFKKIVEKI